MAASATQAPPVRAALQRLVDYAGLFPPAALDMARAVREYVEARSGPYAWMLGRFIVRFSQIEELLGSISSGDTIELSVILDKGIADLDWLAEFRRETRAVDIGAVEVKLPDDTASILDFAVRRRTLGIAELPAFVEAPPEALSTLSMFELGGKIRCGGVTPESYPDCEAVASFIAQAVGLGVPFKATAGLHHPIRHFNEAAGVKMHGFLNVLAAAALARSRSGFSAIQRAVQAEDASRFELGAGGLRFDDFVFDADFLRPVRSENFIGYGSCSFSEPVDDLRAMGMLV